MWLPDVVLSRDPELTLVCLVKPPCALGGGVLAASVSITGVLMEQGAQGSSEQPWQSWGLSTGSLPLITAPQRWLLAPRPCFPACRAPESRTCAQQAVWPAPSSVQRRPLLGPARTDRAPPDPWGPRACLHPRAIVSPLWVPHWVTSLAICSSQPSQAS